MWSHKLTPSWKLPPTWLRFLIIVLLILGIFFRFFNLDRKVYWYDEAFTSLRVSGYLEAEVVQQLSNSPVISIKVLQEYQQPNSEKGVIGTLKSLAVEDPQHPPLYYVIARFWAQGFGSSVAAMRRLPALISLLAFPCIYWLCLELFESSLTGWVAVALIAISPFYVLYAQESREYSLWTVTILLSSAALLRAMRLNTKMSWGIYGVALAASLYTFLFSVLVAIGQGIYVAGTERFRLRKTLIAYLFISISVSLAFIPWLWIVITQLSKVERVMAFTATPASILVFLRGRLVEMIRIFLDLNLGSKDPLIYLLPLIPSLLILLVLVGYSLYFVCRNTQERVWLFILILIGATALPQIMPDLMGGGSRSSIPRYLIPCYLGIQLAVAYLLSTKISAISVNVWLQKLWQFVMITLISFGVLSCTISSQAETWWIKNHDQSNPAIARLINQASRPLLISDAETGDLLSLSHLLHPKVQLMSKPHCYTCNPKSPVKIKPYIPEIPEGFSDVFLYNPRPSEVWLYNLGKEQTYTIEAVSKFYGNWLWRLEKY